MPLISVNIISKNCCIKLVWIFEIHLFILIYHTYPKNIYLFISLSPKQYIFIFSLVIFEKFCILLCSIFEIHTFSVYLLHLLKFILKHFVSFFVLIFLCLYYIVYINIFRVLFSVYSLYFLISFVYAKRNFKIWVFNLS